MAQEGESGWKNVTYFIRLLGRMQIFPCPTIAMISGHAFAGGCMFAMAHDYRYMVKGKGFICLPEIDLNMHLPRGMTTTVQVKVSPSVYTEFLYGKRFTAEEAELKEVITKACNKKSIWDTVMIFAKEILDRGKNKKVVQQLKYQAYMESYESCRIGDKDFEFKPVLRAKI